MKNILKFLLVIITVSIGQQVLGQVYVDQSATGSGNGSSWANAYTSVDDAISNASNGSEIWIAKGKYIQTSTLEITDKGFKIYGSFAGSESSIAGRDFKNETIISGDVMDDDDPNNLRSNMSDNLDLVVKASQKDNELLIDGIVVEGGRGELVGEFSNDKATGGGMILIGKIRMVNSIVRNNLARFGGGIYIQNVSGRAPDIKFEACQFIMNEGIKFGGAIYAAFGGTVVSFDECSFSDNKAEYGATVLVGGASARTTGTITNCMFLNNEGVFGAGLSLDGMVDAVVTGCHFEGNEGVRGGGLYIGEDANSKIEDCVFLKNSAVEIGLGAGMYIQNESKTTIINCEFDSNVGIGAGGGLFSLGNKSDIEIKNSKFNDNSVTGETGLGGGLFAQDSEIEIDNCSFDSNKAIIGGAINLDDCNNPKVVNSNFANNTASLSGAIEVEDSQLELENSTFENNIASISGGAITAFDGGSLTASNCEFTNNESTTNWGGAVYIDGDNDKTNQFDRCSFISNRSAESAAALYHTDGDISLTNCVFADNVASDGGIGNALSLNQETQTEFESKIINCSFYENAGGLGSITLWAGEGAKTNLVIQNNAFGGSGDHIVLEAGTVEVNSEGGNLVSNNSSSDFVNNSQDLNDTDPLYQNPDQGDLTLKDNSPCIDAGVESGAPGIDFNGNNRDGKPDIGAYEKSAATFVQAVQKLEGSLKMLGNPVDKFLRLEFSNDMTGTFRFELMDLNGRILNSQQIIKTGTVMPINMTVEQYEAGLMLFRLTKDNRWITGKFAKL